jgi:hypothetical protein
MNDGIPMSAPENTMKTVAFTCAAINYLPKVRKLFASIREHHPEFELVLALADELPAHLQLQESTIDRVLTPQELNISNLRQWIFFHDIVELSTAIKPFALQKLLAEPNVDRVIYFDPDMILFSRVDDILATLDKHNFALTPHQVAPESTLDAIRDNEIASLKHGVFNLGFIAVRKTEESKRFAAWWADRLYHFCVADIPNGLFTDQKWMNFAPIFFEGVHILKSPRFNVATWNLTTRRVAGDRTHGFTVNGEPLGFYHFTGFDSGAHRIMAVKNGADSPAVFELIRWYEQQTADDANDPLSKLPWGFANFDDGIKIPKAARILFRARLDLRRAFPDPFSTRSEKNYKRWIMQEFGTLDMVTKIGSDGASTMPKRSTVRRIREAVRRYCSEADYRQEIHKMTKSILRSEGLGALVRYVFNRR